MAESGDATGTGQMSPSQPYLLRALNEWIVDNGMTPQLLIDAAHPQVDVPDSIRGEARLVLNISPSAVRDLLIDNEFVSFVARFSGASRGVLIPVQAVLAIYARENGQGMMFPDSADQAGDPAESADTSGREDAGPPRAAGKPDLKVIK